LVFDYTYPDYDVILVDNGSEDEWMEKRYKYKKMTSFNLVIK